MRTFEGLWDSQPNFWVASTQICTHEEKQLHVWLRPVLVWELANPEGIRASKPREEFGDKISSIVDKCIAHKSRGALR